MPGVAGHLAGAEKQIEMVVLYFHILQFPFVSGQGKIAFALPVPQSCRCDEP